MPSTCPHCGDTVQGGNFCGSCGDPLTKVCPDCGQSYGGEKGFCGRCGVELVLPSAADDGSPAEGRTDGSMRLADNELAKRVDEDVLGEGGLIGRLTQKKSVQIEAGNRALLLEHGELVKALGPGKHTLDSLGERLLERRRSKDITVVLVEDADVPLSLTVDDVRTADGFPVSVTVDLDVSLDDAEAFFRAAMADRNAVTTEAVKRLLEDALRDEVRATLSSVERDNLYGNRDVKQSLQSDIDEECRAVLSDLGLSLVRLRAFDYDDGRDEIRSDQRDVAVREEREDIRDDESRLDRRERERETEDSVHETKQEFREESAEASADHELERQRQEQRHEVEDAGRQHEHTAERETVEHEEELKTTRTESEVERREVEHEQDVSEMEDLLDVKSKKDEQKLERERREQEMEMDREEHDLDLEKERLDARDDVDAQTLASLDDTDDGMTDLAKMDKAENLSADQLDSLGAQNSDELAKARQEANSAEKERERVEDQKEFREELKEMASDSMDRMESTTETAMDQMGDAASAAAEDTSDNVIVSGDSGSSGGDTTIVQGGDPGGSDGGAAEPSGGRETVLCSECGSEQPPGNNFCTSCRAELPHSS
ncbi:SPFH domain-containing protein [Salarchaeum sp. III]|uniref:SPFH domain-containing protein n=1 Tax=Salarchaeum sp. III TaxID=3107927 RepID=UPI002ED799B7